MEYDKLKVAVAEARRFLRAAAAIEKPRYENASILACKASGTLRRASLDLTRALADLRRYPVAEQEQKRRTTSEFEIVDVTRHGVSS